MITLGSFSPDAVTPFTLANDPKVWGWSSLVSRLQKSKRTLVVTGAGISVEAGIPVCIALPRWSSSVYCLLVWLYAKAVHTWIGRTSRHLKRESSHEHCSKQKDFRSEDGLYALVKRRYPQTVVQGKDLFDAGLFRSPETAALFYTFMGELSVLCQKAQTTATHGFISFLHERGTLLRWYTQNIDGLEERVLVSLLPTVTSKEEVEVDETYTEGKKPAAGKSSKKFPLVVHLHGNLQSVKCTLCPHQSPMEDTHVKTFREGIAPVCPACEDVSEIRAAQGKRALSRGTLRPDVVLYNEHHAGGDTIAQVLTHDHGRKPSALLVMGTSLKVAGIRAAVKSLAKTILAADGVVVLINDRPLGKEWEGVFTHWVRGKCDAICLDMQRCMGELKAPPRLRPSTPGKALSSPVSNKATLSKGTASSVPSITAKAPSVKAPTKAKSSAILPARAPSKASAPKAPVVKTAVSKTVTKTITKKKTVEEKDAATKSPLLPINDTQKLVTGLLRQSKTSVAAAKDTKPKTIAVMAREPRAATSAKTRRPIAPL